MQLCIFITSMVNNICIDEQYKSGIYKISTTLNNKVYIGSAVCLIKRYIQHKSDLIRNKHNKRLQNFVNKYGIDKLVFSLLELVDDPSYLIEREQYYIDMYKSYKSNLGYNVCPNAGSVLGVKMPQSHKDACRTRMLGRTHLKGIPRSESAKTKNSNFWKNNPERLQVMKDKNRESQSKVDRSRWIKGKLIEVYKDGTLIDTVKSLKIVCMKYNLTHSCASKVLQNKQNHTKGYDLKSIGRFFEK